ncbi:hypothetical protein LCGC14_2179990, partial [marine sediment metagenome]
MSSHNAIAAPTGISHARAPRPRIGSLTRDLPGLALATAALGALIVVFLGDSFTLNILAGTFLFAGLATSWNVIGG